MSKYPGVDRQEFTITMTKNELQCDQVNNLTVTKIYKQNLWRKFLLRLGFRVKLFEVKRIS